MVRTPDAFVRDVWVFQSHTYATNSGIILDGSDAVLIDPGLTPEDLELLRRFLRHREARARFVILTHAHWDHLLGAAAFPGCDIVAQQRYLQGIQRHRQDLVRQVTRWQAEEGLVPDTGFLPPWPTVTFDRRVSLHLDNRELILIHAPGHSPDQCAVFVPDVGLLWAGDMLSDGEPPMAMDGIPHYIQTLRDLQGLPIQALVPGHGTPTDEPPTIRRRFRQDVAYLESLQQCVIRQVQRDASMEATLVACREVRFVQPDSYPYAHVWNIESAYAALREKAGKGPIGWEKDWL
jgi:hydroxyacylglutathione hydrolase